MLDGFDRLGLNPGHLLIRVGPPIDALQYDLIIRAPLDPPRDHLFVLTVLYATDEERLLVVACDHEFEDLPGMKLQ